MRVLSAVAITFSLVVISGCKYGMSDNPTVEDNPELFDKRGRSVEAVGINAGNDRFLIVIPRGVCW